MTDDRRTPYCLHEERSSVDWRPSRMAVGFEISLTFEGSEQETRTFVLELSSEALEQLEGEAKRQEIRLDRLFEHAAMLYIADLDAGRVAKRITERTDL